MRYFANTPDKPIHTHTNNCGFWNICLFLATTITSTTEVLLGHHFNVLLSFPHCADLEFFALSTFFFLFSFCQKGTFQTRGIINQIFYSILIKHFFPSQGKSKASFFSVPVLTVCLCFVLILLSGVVCVPVSSCVSAQAAVCSYSLQAYRACQRVLTYIVTVES